MDLNPFTDKDRERIDASLRELDAAEELARRSQAAGIDTSAQMARIEEARAKLLGLRRQFFQG